MTHNPDMQKEAIIAHQKRDTSLAECFETIMYDPYMSVEDRRAKLLTWAHENRSNITTRLKEGE